MNAFVFHGGRASSPCGHHSSALSHMLSLRCDLNARPAPPFEPLGAKDTRMNLCHDCDNKPNLRALYTKEAHDNRDCPYERAAQWRHSLALMRAKAKLCV